MNNISNMIDDCLNHDNILTSKHVAIISKYNIPITKPVFNYPISNTCISSIHAEVSAIYEFLKQNGQYVNKYKRLNITNITNKKILKRLSTCSIVVLRINPRGKLAESKPCYHCLEDIKKLKIKYVYYSTSSGKIVKEKTKNMKTNHVCRYNKNIL